MDSQKKAFTKEDRHNIQNAKITLLIILVIVSALIGYSISDDVVSSNIAQLITGVLVMISVFCVSLISDAKYKNMFYSTKIDNVIEDNDRKDEGLMDINHPCSLHPSSPYYKNRFMN
ncbi:MAG: hypothetical protein O2809_02065 [Proteobacteria bacterium]|nr:hypothetical protein [Pseudomonadota bacterium]